MVKIKEKDIKEIRIIAKLAEKDIEIKGIFRLKFEPIFTWNIKDAWRCEEKRIRIK